MKGLRLKDLGSFKTGLTYSPDNLCDLNEGVLVLRSANIQNDRIDLGDCVYVNSSIPSSMYVRNGDILICSRNGSANLVGKTAIIDNDLNATWGAFMMLLRTKYNSRYINYLLNIAIKREKGRFATSTINQLTNSMLGGIHVDLLTDEMEQQRIVDYLDTKLSEIDNRVSVLEKQMDAYTRLKKSIIHQAVTRGLNPDVRLKDSGIEWIGMIPEHWTIRRIKEIGNVNSGTTPSTKNEKYYNNGIHPWINTGCVQDCDIIEPADYVTDLALKECKGLKFFPVDSIILAMYGGGTIGNVGILKISATINQACCAITIDNKIAHFRYCFYSLLSMKKWIISRGFGGTQVNLSQGQISNFVISLPPLSEQKTIAAYLDEKCAKIDAAIENIGKQIETSKRLKRAIINEAISGKTAI